MINAKFHSYKIVQFDITRMWDGQAEGEGKGGERKGLWVGNKECLGWQERQDDEMSETMHV